MWPCRGGFPGAKWLSARWASEAPSRPLPSVDRRARYLIRFFEWLAAIRRSQVVNFDSPRNESMLLKTVTKTSWAMSSASARVPTMRRTRLNTLSPCRRTTSLNACSSRCRSRPMSRRSARLIAAEASDAAPRARARRRVASTEGQTAAGRESSPSGRGDEDPAADTHEELLGAGEVLLDAGIERRDVGDERQAHRDQPGPGVAPAPTPGPDGDPLGDQELGASGEPPPGVRAVGEIVDGVGGQQELAGGSDGQAAREGAGRPIAEAGVGQVGGHQPDAEEGARLDGEPRIEREPGHQGGEAGRDGVVGAQAQVPGGRAQEEVFVEGEGEGGAPFVAAADGVVEVRVIDPASDVEGGGRIDDRQVGVVGAGAAHLV